MTNQIGDILIYGSTEGAEINEIGGYIEMTTGLETAVILSLFGGNDLDDGSESTDALQWWGNDGEPTERHLRSEFSAAINGGPVNSASIVTIRDAAQRDLDRDLVATGRSKSVTVKARLDSPKRLQLQIQVLTWADELLTINKEVNL